MGAGMMLGLGLAIGGVATMRGGGGAAPGGTTAIVPANWDVIGFGDSRTEDGVAAQLDAAGYRPQTRNYGYAGWLGPVSAGRLRLGRHANFGISVSTTSHGAANPRQSAFGDAPPAEPKARNATYPGEWWRGSTTRGNPGAQEAGCGPGNKRLTDAAAHDAGIVVIRYGVNDGTGYDGASRANLQTILNGLRGDQLKVLVAENPTGVAAATGESAVKAAASDTFKAFADWQKTLDVASGHANARADVVTVDAWAEYLDAAASSADAWTNKRGYLRDGLHDTPYAGKRLAELIHARLGAAYGVTYANLPGRVVLPTGNPAGGVAPAGAGNGASFVHTNPTLQPGGNGIIAGNIGTPPAAASVPEGWRLGGAAAANSAGIAVASEKTGTDSDGYPTWKVTVSGTLPDQTTYTLQMFQLTRAAGQPGLAARLRGVGRIKVAPGSAGLEAVSLRAYVQSPTAARTQQAVALSGSAGSVGQRGGFVLAQNGCDAAGDHLYETPLIDLADPNMDAANGGPGVMDAVTNAIVYVEAKFDNYTGAAIPVAAELTLSRVGMLLAAG